MSRIGKRPVAVPAGVTVDLKGNTIAVKGPKGELARTLHPEMAVAFADGQVSVTRPSDEKRHKALHGLTRTLVANMVEGVTAGYQKVLELQGVGYKAEVKPFGINLIVGLSHQVPFKAPEGIKITVENNTVVRIQGASKELVGQVAAEIRVGPAARALQGQGHPLPGRAGPPQGRQDRSQVGMRAIHAPKTRREQRLPPAPPGPAEGRRDRWRVRGWSSSGRSSTSTPSWSTTTSA